MNSKKKQFAINAGSGFMAQMVAVGVGFIMMPYVIWRLGDEAYGVYQLARSALVFFMFLQLGMGPTLIRFCSQAIAKDDQETIHRISSTSQLILGALGLLGMIAVIALTPFFLGFYDIPADMTFDTSVLLFCMAVSLLLNMLFIVPSGLVLGNNRYDLVNGTEIVANLLRLGLVVATFELFGPSVLMMGVCILATQSFRFIVLFAFAIKTIGRSALFSVRMVNRESLRSMAGFSALNLVNSVAGVLVFQGPILIIGKVLGIEAVTMFAPAVLVGTSMQGFLGQLSRPLVPLASQAQAENDHPKMGKWSISVGRVVACTGLAIVLTLCVFGSELIGLWLGQDMAHIWSIIAIMAFGTVLSQTQAVNYYLALGGGNIHPTVYSQVLLGIVASGGVAIGTVFFNWELFEIALFIVMCRCLRNMFYLTYAYSKQLSYSVFQYLAMVYGGPLLVFAIAVGIGYLIKSIIMPNSLLLLSVEIIAVMMLYSVLAWCFLIPVEVKSSVWKLRTTYRGA